VSFQKQLRMAKEAMSCCGKTTTQTPGMGVKLVTASRALGRVVEAAINGAPVAAEKSVVLERLKVCAACENVKVHFGGFMLCRKCGCGLNGRVRRKAFLATETCELWTTSNL
jgi:hypothetical protein